jgi:hypothetical protein
LFVRLVDARQGRAAVDSSFSRHIMIHHIWRLGEAGPDNLGLAVSDDGLLLGRTPLIERRDGCFVVRERAEIEQQRCHRCSRSIL